MAFGGGSLGSAYGQIIIETNRAVANINALRGGLNNFAQQTQSVGFALATLSRSVLGFAGVLAALPTAGVKFFADYEEQLRNVASISPEFAANFQDYSASILDMSAATGRSATELASALYDIAQSGYEGAEALGILGAAADLANAGMTNAKVGAEVLVGILNSGITDYGGGLIDATKASDLFFQTVFRGVITAEELGQQLGDNLALATALGISLPEVLTAYDVLTRQKVLPAEAATQINALMSAFLKPTEELQAIFESQDYLNGVDLLKRGYDGETGIVAAVKFLDDLLAGDFGEIEDVSGNIRAIRGIVGLLAGDTALWNQEWVAINDSAGATQKALEQQEKSLKFIFRQFRESFKAALIEGAEPIVPALKAILKAGTAVIEMWRDMAPAVKNFFSLLLPIGAAVYGLAGIFLLLLSRLYTIRTGLAFLGLGITTVLGPLGLLTLGLTTLATLLLNNTGGITNIAQAIGQLFNTLKLFGTLRLGGPESGTKQLIDAYGGIVELLDGPLGQKRALRIVKALTEVREPTRRLVKQFQRMGQAAENFLNIMTGDADAAEIGRFHERLDALFGSKAGTRMWAQVFRMKNAFDNLKQSIGETFGVQPWQTTFTRWITDGIARWGDLATFIRREVIPTMGQHLENAMIRATRAMDTLRLALPRIQSAIQGVRTTFGSFVDDIMEGDFRGALANLEGMADQILGLFGTSFDGLVIDLRVSAINLFNDAKANAQSFVNDLLAGMGFDVATGNEGGLVGYTIGRFIAKITGVDIEGGESVGDVLRQRINDFLGIGSDSTGGPNMDNPGLTHNIGRVTVNILTWTVNALESLWDAVKRFVDATIGSPGVPGLAGRPGPTDLDGGDGSRSGFANIGDIAVTVTKWTVNALESIVAGVGRYWDEHKDEVKAKIFEIPEIIGEIGTFVVTLAEGSPSLQEHIERFLVLAAIGFALVPFGIPAVAVSVGGFLVSFLSTGLSDFVQFVVETLTALGVTAEDMGDLPVQIGGIAVDFIVDLSSEFARELRESKVIVEEFTGWNLTLGTPEGGIDATGIVVSIIESIGNAFTEATESIATLGTLASTFNIGQKIGEGLVAFIAASLESLFAVSDLASKFPALAGSLAVAAGALLAGIAKGIMSAIADNVSGDIQENMGEGDSFGEALAKVLVDWAIAGAQAGFALINIVGLGFPQLSIDLAQFIWDGIIKEFPTAIRNLANPQDDAGVQAAADAVVDAVHATREYINGRVRDAIRGDLTTGEIGLGPRNPFDELGDSTIPKPTAPLRSEGHGLMWDFYEAITGGPGSLIADTVAFIKQIDDIAVNVTSAINGFFDKISDAFSGAGRKQSAGGQIAGLLELEDSRQATGGISGMIQGIVRAADELFGINWTDNSVANFFEGIYDWVSKVAGPIVELKDALLAIKNVVTGDEESGVPEGSRFGQSNIGSTNNRGSGGDGIPGTSKPSLPSESDFAGGIKGARDLGLAFGDLRGSVDPTNSLIGRFREQIGLTETPLERMRQNIGDKGVATLQRFATTFRTFGDDVAQTAPIIGQSFNPVIENMKQQVAGLGPAFGGAAASLRDNFLPTVVATLQEARDNGNLHFAAMILRAQSFGFEFAAVAATAVDGFKNAFALGMVTTLGIVGNGLNMIRSLVSGFDLYNQGYFIGNSLGLGVARGINDSIGAVQAAASQLIFAVNMAQIAAGKIKSPSELTRKEVGRMLGAGVALGLTDMIPMVRESSQDVVYAALGTANGAITNGIAGAAYGPGTSAPVFVHVEPKVNELDDVKQIIEFFRVLPAHMATM